MGAVSRQVAADPSKAVARAGLDPVGPKIWSPHDGRSHDWSLRRNEVELWVSLDLLLDHPAVGKRPFVGVRLGIEAIGGVAGVDAAREVGDATIGEPPAKNLKRPGDVVGQDARVGRKLALSN